MDTSIGLIGFRGHKRYPRILKIRAYLKKHMMFCDYKHLTEMGCKFEYKIQKGLIGKGLINKSIKRS